MKQFFSFPAYAQMVKWQTQETQNLPPKKRVGSNPTLGTKLKQKKSKKKGLVHSLEKKEKKKKLAPWIKSVVEEVFKGDLKEAIFADIFAGTGQVARHFKKHVKK